MYISISYEKVVLQLITVQYQQYQKDYPETLSHDEMVKLLALDFDILELEFGNYTINQIGNVLQVLPSSKPKKRRGSVVMTKSQERQLLEEFGVKNPE